MTAETREWAGLAHRACQHLQRRFGRAPRAEGVAPSTPWDTLASAPSANGFTRAQSRRAVADVSIARGAPSAEQERGRVGAGRGSIGVSRRRIATGQAFVARGWRRARCDRDRMRPAACARTADACSSRRTLSISMAQPRTHPLRPRSARRGPEADRERPASVRDPPATDSRRHRTQRPWTAPIELGRLRLTADRDDIVRESVPIGRATIGTLLASRPCDRAAVGAARSRRHQVDQCRCGARLPSGRGSGRTV